MSSSGDMIKVRSRRYELAPSADADRILEGVLKGYDKRLNTRDIEFIWKMRNVINILECDNGVMEESDVLRIHHEFGGASEGILKALMSTDKEELETLAKSDSPTVGVGEGIMRKYYPAIQIAALCNANQRYGVLMEMRENQMQRLVGFVASQAEMVRAEKKRLFRY